MCTYFAQKHSDPSQHTCTQESPLVRIFVFVSLVSMVEKICAHLFAEMIYTNHIPLNVCDSSAQIKWKKMHRLCLTVSP